MVEGNALYEAYNMLLATFQYVMTFVFNDSVFFTGGFSYGNLMLTASLAWIVIRSITHGYLQKERYANFDRNTRELHDKGY